MTIASQTAYAQFQGNGAATSFATNIPAYEGNAIKVYLQTGEEDAVLMVEPTDYTLSGVRKDSTEESVVTVNMTVAPPVGTILLIQRRTPKTQLIDIFNQRGFLPEVIEEALDRIVMILQELSVVDDEGNVISGGNATLQDLSQTVWDAGESFELAGISPVKLLNVLQNYGVPFTAEDKAALDSIGVEGGTDDQVAAEVLYNNANSALTAEDVQAALDEVVATIKALAISDDQTAAEVSYDNTASGLTASNVQNAIDELVSVDVTFNTVADLQSATLSAGLSARTLGYNTIGDGGHGVYLIKSSGTVDGYIDFDITGGNKAFRQVAGVITPVMAGAVGDGVTDDSNAVYAAAQYAIDHRVTLAGEDTKWFLTGPNIPTSEYSHVRDINLKAVKDTTTPYVIVLSGEANASGTGGTGGTFKVNPNVQVWAASAPARTDYQFRVADLATTTYYCPDGQMGGGANNIGIACAHRIQELTGRPVYVVFNTAPSKTIWEWYNFNTDVDGPMLTGLESALTPGLAALGETTIDAFLWQQGESDFGNNLYGDQLYELQAYLRTKTWMKWNSPFVAGQPSRDTPAYDNVGQFIYRLALLHNDSFGNNTYTPPASYKSIFSTYVTSRGLTTAVNNVDFTGDSLWELGYYRFAEAICKVGTSFPYMFNVTTWVTKFRNIHINCNHACNGFKLRNIEDCQVRGLTVVRFVENGIKTEVKAGQAHFTDVVCWQHEYGEPGYNTRPGRLGIGINAMTADTYFTNTLAWYCKYPIRASGFFNCQFDTIHPFNGTPEIDTVPVADRPLEDHNILVEPDTYHVIINNVYSDRGRITLHTPDVIIDSGISTNTSGYAKGPDFELVSHGANASFAELSISGIRFTGSWVGGSPTPIAFTSELGGSFVPEDDMFFNWTNMLVNNGADAWKSLQTKYDRRNTDGRSIENVTAKQFDYFGPDDWMKVDFTRGVFFNADHNVDPDDARAVVLIGSRGTPMWEFGPLGSLAPMLDNSYQIGYGTRRPANVFSNKYTLREGIASPATISDHGQIYDDGQLRYKRSNGSVVNLESGAGGPGAVETTGTTSLVDQSGNTSARVVNYTRLIQGDWVEVWFTNLANLFNGGMTTADQFHILAPDACATGFGTFIGNSVLSGTDTPTWHAGTLFMFAGENRVRVQNQFDSTNALGYLLWSEVTGLTLNAAYIKYRVA